MNDKLLKFKREIENIEITYDYDKVYFNLRNAVTDYENETQDWLFEELFEDYLDYDLAEMVAKDELENGGLLRLYYFLGDANLNNSLFRINGYGNLEDVYKDDLEYLKEEIINIIDDNLTGGE